MDLLDDTGQYVKIPTVSGQACNENRFERMTKPVAGRSWLWAEDATNRLDQYAVTLNVTGWPAGAAEDELVRVAKDLGACRFGRLTEVSQVSMDGEQWLAWSQRQDGMFTGHAARRTAGDVVVAVSVDSPAGREDALKTAERLAASAAERVSAAGLGKPGGARIDPEAEPSAPSNPPSTG
jgi:hypothetical protein